MPGADAGSYAQAPPPTQDNTATMSATASPMALSARSCRHRSPRLPHDHRPRPHREARPLAVERWTTGRGSLPRVGKGGALDAAEKPLLCEGAATLLSLAA
jgi:hypothetical protein